ncbi:hypothetical protein [Arthrobacter monumenti]
MTAPATYWLSYAKADAPDVVVGLLTWNLIFGAIAGTFLGVIGSVASYFVLRSGNSAPTAAGAAFAAVAAAWMLLLIASSSTGVGFPLAEITTAALSAAATAAFVLVVLHEPCRMRVLRPGRNR